jgi:hypothetical protein
MLSVKELILNENYSMALKDVKYSFLIKLFLRFWLANNSDERPDFITAKKVFTQMFCNNSESVSELNETLEATINLNTWNWDLILDAISMHYSESKQKNDREFSKAHSANYDTPNGTEFNKRRSKSSRTLWDLNKKQEMDDYYPETILPLKLDEKFSDCQDPSASKTDKIAQFLDKLSEESPQILPMPKIGNQQNPFTKKSPMCRIHNKLATKTCMLVHYGEYFWDLCEHECGEVEDIRQSDKIRK